MSSLSQFVTILWLFKYVFFRQQSNFFYENRNLTISLSCFKYCNGSLYPQDKITKLYSGQVLQPDLCYLPSPLLHCAYPLLSQHHTSATLASLQFLECIHPSQVFFEQKSLFLIFSKPVQIFCPSNLSLNTTPAGKIFPESQTRLDASITHSYSILYFYIAAFISILAKTYLFNYLFKAHLP